MSSNASLSSMQRLVEQLKLEAGVERIKVSQAAAELQQYCMQNACKDALLIGVPAGSNPFREPRSCHRHLEYRVHAGVLIGDKLEEVGKRKMQEVRVIMTAYKYLKGANTKELHYPI
ncbi:protein dispatched-like protein 1 [Platysternon megacephalum]|uniref:Guanine nucleotide-binding protein subunit gamma n=1 Tax=Platysternon megacephalum TaxID=55544 RepID=A0A4D9ETA2_9SAUR|nr:protein dispatched-like protein 1 [Platysternon megacephalum]